MSKINAIRIINLNYNNHSIRIEDETFRFEGESTLLSLQNGGGKSVLVQMLIAPFVHKRYRDTSDRPFASYFTTNRPTFIMVEWKLDQGAGYVLTGMMVRKRQEPTAESVRDELDMINFIHEYKGESKYDIHNMPVVIKEGMRKKLQSFASCKNMFEEWKRERGRFQYFDMNQYAQQKLYFDRLQEFQINYSEWESIVKKVNLKESGLSELFREAKDEEGLVGKWFLPAVESKLSKDEDRIKRFQEIIFKYIRQYKENQSKIERRDTIHSFQGDACMVLEKAKKHQNTANKKVQYESKIALLRDELSCFYEEAQQNQRKIKEQIFNLEFTLKQVQLEEISYGIYCKMDDLQSIRQNHIEMVQQRDRIQKEKKRLEKRIHILECARLYEDYKSCSYEVLFLENKLDILKKQEKELMPEREQLGFNLRIRYEDLLEKKQKLYQQLENHLQQHERNRKEKEVEKDNNQKSISDLKLEIGRLQERVKAFDEKENNLYQRYQVKLERNILGAYEEGDLEFLVEDYSKKEQNGHSELLILKKNSTFLEQERNSCIRDLEDCTGELAKNQMRKEQKSDLLEDYEQQLEIRRNTLRLMELQEHQIFEMSSIEESFRRKINYLKNIRYELVRQKERCEQELENLETGRMLEIPKEFAELMANLDLHFVFGMDWIKRNNYSKEENLTLVRQNPLLPYSIIMSKKEMERLQKAQSQFYTSFPIPIVLRESLDQALGNVEGNVCSFLGISFFIVFNDQLLNEESLIRLIEGKKYELDQILDKIVQRDKEIYLYEDKWNELRYQTVSEADFGNLKKELEKLEEQKKHLELELTDLRYQKEEQGKQLEQLANDIERKKELVKIYEQIHEELMNVKEAYTKYQGQRYDLEKCRTEANKLEERQNQLGQELREINHLLQEGKDRRNKEIREIEEVKQKLQPFLYYSQGKIDQRDLEDLEARYEAITKEIGADQKQLEEQLEKESKRYKSAETLLLNQQARYHLDESDYSDEIADILLENEVNRELGQTIKEFDSIQGEVNQIEKNIAVQENKLQDVRMKLEEDHGVNEPISRDKITDLEFAKRRKLIQAKIKQEEELYGSTEAQIRNYQSNRDSLEEYNYFKVNAEITLEEELSPYAGKRLNELQTNEITVFRGKLIRDYNACKDLLVKHREEVKKEIDIMEKKSIYEDDFFYKPIYTLQELIDSPEAILEQLNVVLASYLAILEKLEIDIAILTKEKERLIQMLLDYIEDVHKNLDKIDRNSTIMIRERSVKMLKIKLADWAEQENVYRTRLHDLIEDVTIRGLNRLQKNENMEEMLGTYITTKNLYHTIVGINSINIKLYKIEAQKEYPISWAEVAKNSGGEGFLSAFVVLSSLLSYIRREDTDIFMEREEGKVLVMDNPFAQTNAAHLLKPLMDVAKKNNTQLICLTGLGGESIYNRFDNIYVLNLMDSGLTRDIQYLKGNHIKGQEEPQSIVASQVKVETMEQMELLF